MLLGHMISTNLNFRAKRDRLSVFCREVKKKKKKSNGLSGATKSLNKKIVNENSQ